jgi:hypothetical protein
MIAGIFSSAKSWFGIRRERVRKIGRYRFIAGDGEGNFSM